jgi:hypothetical protein
MANNVDDYIQVANSILSSPRITQSSALGAAYDSRKNATGIDTIEDEHHRARMIGMRLRLSNGVRWPYQHLSSALAGEKVFVFVVQDNQPVTLVDEAPMFPSDQLITQLRLLQK